MKQCPKIQVSIFSFFFLEMAHLSVSLLVEKTPMLCSIYSSITRLQLPSTDQCCVVF